MQTLILINSLTKYEIFEEIKKSNFNEMAKRLFYCILCLQNHWLQHFAKFKLHIFISIHDSFVSVECPKFNDFAEKELKKMF